MHDNKDQGAIPQGLIEQARAKNIDPGHLQMLGKQAASMYSDQRTPLTEAVLKSIGDEDLGPEHARRVCEFANQAAFQSEWEKGGSIRNIEFEGGTADPAVVLREMNDGAREPAVRVQSDYDIPPPKLASADSRVEEEIFAGFTNSMPHSSEVAPGMPDMVRLRTTLQGSQDHIFSKIASLGVTKETVGQEMADLASNEVLEGTPLYKVAAAWTHFTADQSLFREALDITTARMKERGLVAELQLEKFANMKTERIPNPAHPIVSRFIEFTKIATQLRILKESMNVLQEQLEPVNKFIKTGGALGIALRSAIVPGAVGGGIGALAAKPGERGRGALRGAVVGGALGAGAGLGARAALKKPLQATALRGTPKEIISGARKMDPTDMRSAMLSLQPNELRQAGKRMLIGTGVGAAGGLGAGVLGSKLIGPKKQPGYVR